MEFKILRKSKKSRARIGVIKTPHGTLQTPAFFPVATQAAVKSLTSKEIKEIGFEGVLCNTYHLMLRPGSNLIKKAGGLHKFMNFKGVIETDSGGFQVFSLGKGKTQKVGKIVKISPSKKLTNLDDRPNLLTKHCPSQNISLVKIREQGVYFRSHIDGSEHFLSPETSIQIQNELGSDIMFVLDECTSPFDDFAYTKKAMERTHRWAERCIKQAQKLKFKQKKKALFGIIQGGKWEKLRKESAEFMASLDFDGFGIGGVFGENKNKMFKILDAVTGFLPEKKPRHLLGIGYLKDIKEAVKRGIDLFDCVYPTRFARHGTAFINENKKLDFSKSKLLKDNSPMDKNCSCFVCKNHKRNYIAHLFQAKEITAMRFLTYHNLWFFKKFMDNLREQIAKREF